MALIDMTFRLLKRLNLRPKHYGIEAFALAPSMKAVLAAEASGLAANFYAHDGRVVHKWTHYLDIYQKHFSRYQETDVRFLEIGVFEGGSLEMWRKYFGSAATIFGIDIDPRCSGFVTAPNQVRIGSQADKQFVCSVVSEMGGLDVVLDDGSHVAAHQRVSFELLFPMLNDGGIYVIEDTHTAYWPGDHRGGYRRAGTIIEYVKRLIDDMHAPYHGRDELESNASMHIPAIHVYDSIIIIEKNRRAQPAHIQVGGGR